MVGQETSPPASHAKDRRPIVRPLPPMDSDDTTGAHTDEVPMIVFGIDKDWFNAHWYGKRPDGWVIRLGHVVHRLWRGLGAPRMFSRVHKPRPSDARRSPARVT